MGDPVQQRDRSRDDADKTILNDHKHVLTFGDATAEPLYWVCDSCEVMFVQHSDMESVAVWASASVDVASEILWGFHQRALTQYGPGMGLEEDESATEDCVQTGREHTWELGKCTRCGTSLFLGE